LREYSAIFEICGLTLELKALDFVALGIILILSLILLVTMFTDLRDYSRLDPKK